MIATLHTRKYMEKVKIVYFGKTVLVDSDQVEILKRKQELVELATNYQYTITKNKHLGLDSSVVSQAMSDTLDEIIQLNRDMRQNIQVVI